MGVFEIVLVAVGLAMDAFAVSVCKGLALNKVKVKNMLIVSVWFGVFQGLMPLLGFLLSSLFSKYVITFSPYISFALLALIGINMIRESFSKEEECCDSSLGFKVMLFLAIATSIDAFATGVTFALQEVNIVLAVVLIASITFVISALGIVIGSFFGNKFKSKAEFFGGFILVCLGITILIEALIAL